MWTVARVLLSSDCETAAYMFSFLVWTVSGVYLFVWWFSSEHQQPTDVSLATVCSTQLNELAFCSSLNFWTIAWHYVCASIINCSVYFQADNSSCWQWLKINFFSATKLLGSIACIFVLTSLSDCSSATLCIWIYSWPLSSLCSAQHL